MSTNFLQQLKEKSKSKTGLAALKAQMEQASGADYNNQNIWTPEIDNAGNFSGIIRFLPACEGEDNPIIQLYSHGFQIGERWFIENCPSTLGRDHKCPVCTENSELWNTGLEENKQIARSRKRQKSYYSNILVISDPKHPENEGKTFVFRYGEKIHGKIQDAIKPEEGLGDEPYDPFDLWEGANFRLIIRRVEGYRNYDKSKFDAPKALSDDNQYLTDVLSKLHPLAAIAAPDKFKTFDELATKFGEITRVLTKDRAYSQTAAMVNDSPARQAAPESSVSASDDDDLERFKEMFK